MQRLVITCHYTDNVSSYRSYYYLILLVNEELVVKFKCFVANQDHRSNLTYSSHVLSRLVRHRRSFGGRNPRLPVYLSSRNTSDSHSANSSFSHQGAWAALARAESRKVINDTTFYSFIQRCDSDRAWQRSKVFTCYFGVVHSATDFLN